VQSNNGAYSKTECRIGLAPVGVVCSPENRQSGDINAGRKAMFSIARKAAAEQRHPEGHLEQLYSYKDVWNNTWWMDPIFLGKYPEDGLKFYGNEFSDS